MITGYPENEGRRLFGTLAHPRWGAAGLQTPPPISQTKLKKRHELCRHDINVLRDLHFSHYSRLINSTVE